MDLDRRCKRQSRAKARKGRRFLSALVTVALMLGTGSVRAGIVQQDEAFLPPGLLAEVIILPQPVATGDTIHLGDIARIVAQVDALSEQLSELVVGRAALPGESRRMSVGTLRLRLRQAGLPEKKIAFRTPEEPFSVLTRSQVVTAERLMEVVKSWYVQSLAVPDEAELNVRVEAEDEVVPVGEIDVRIAGAQPRWGRVVVPLNILLSGKTYKRVNVRVDASVDQPVMVTSRAFKRGEAIGAAQVEVKDRTLTEPGAGLIRLEQGVRTTRYVREGTVLSWDVVEFIPDVLRGERVRLTARTESVVVQAVGVAQTDAHVGDALPVRNMASGKTVYGVLAADGTVTVEVW